MPSFSVLVQMTRKLLNGQIEHNNNNNNNNKFILLAGQGLLAPLALFVFYNNGRG